MVWQHFKSESIKVLLNFKLIMLFSSLQFEKILLIFIEINIWRYVHYKLNFYLNEIPINFIINFLKKLSIISKTRSKKKKHIQKNQIEKSKTNK